MSLTVGIRRIPVSLAAHNPLCMPFISAALPSTPFFSGQSLLYCHLYKKSQSATCRRPRMYRSRLRLLTLIAMVALLLGCTQPATPEPGPASPTGETAGTAPTEEATTGEP